MLPDLKEFVMSERKRIFIVGASRTPIGRHNGALAKVTPAQMTQHVMTQALRRAGEPAGLRVEQLAQHVDEVIFAQAFPSRSAPNIGRFAWIKAGFPHHVPGKTEMRECGSGMESVLDAMIRMRAGEGNMYVVGGVESMTQAPYEVSGRERFRAQLQRWVPTVAVIGSLLVFAILRWLYGALLWMALIPAILLVAGLFGVRALMANLSAKMKYGPRPYIGLVEDPFIHQCNLWDLDSTNMAGTAQRVADKYGIARHKADAFSLQSQERANRAIDSGRFAKEIDAINGGDGFVETDEGPRRGLTMNDLAGKKPSPKTRDITAANSSSINDGACALVLVTEDKLKELGLTPLAELVDGCVVAGDAKEMGIQPVYAVEKLLQRTGLTMSQIGVLEINEAFAAQALACIEQLQKRDGLDLEKTRVNPNGGAIALGHPIAMSGARVVQTLCHELEVADCEYGIGTLCVGGGQAVVVCLKRVRK